LSVAGELGVSWWGGGAAPCALSLPEDGELLCGLDAGADEPPPEEDDEFEELPCGLAAGADEPPPPEEDELDELPWGLGAGPPPPDPPGPVPGPSVLMRAHRAHRGACQPGPPSVGSTEDSATRRTTGAAVRTVVMAGRSGITIPAIVAIIALVTTIAPTAGAPDATPRRSSARTRGRLVDTTDTITSCSTMVRAR
jgi:hypothetical protein